MFQFLFKKKNKVERNLQLEFNEILKNIVYPFFKELEFRKNGNGFNKNISELTQVVNIQKSRWNHQDNVSFTFNIGFFATEIYTENGNNEIPKFIREYDCQISTRLGQLVKGNDYWYELHKNTTKENLEMEIHSHLNDYLRPFLEKNIVLISLKDLILNDENINLTTSEISKIQILIKVGEIERAKELLNTAFSNALNPKDYVSKIVYPDGTEEIQTSTAKINTEYVERLKRIGKENSIKIKY